MEQKYRFKHQPYAHQLKALKDSWNKHEWAWLMDMGTGKTKVAIDNMAVLYDRGAITGALIIAPKGVYRNWTDKEIPQHLPEHVEYRVGTWSSALSKQEERKIIDLFDPDIHDLKILVMNVEAFSSGKGTKLAEKFLLAHSTYMAIDESTTIKNPKAKRTKTMVKLGKFARFRRIMTGSPVTKSPLDLYSQCEFLNPQLLGFPSYYSFCVRYANMIKRSSGSHTYHQILGFQNLDELSEILKSFSTRVLKEECLDLPDKVFTTRRIEMTPEQKRMYKEMKKYAMTVINEEGDSVSATVVITQLLRLHQISCGFATSDDGGITKIPNNRLKELMSILEETDGKVILWATYRHDIQLLTEEISKVHGPESVVTYYGDTTVEERQRAVKSFQDPNDPVRFFIGNPSTGGYGLTLTEANTVIYYSNSYDLEKRLQSEDRAHRIGQTKSVTYIDLIAEDTVDEKIVKALLNKQNIANQIMDEEWKEWLKQE